MYRVGGADVPCLDLSPAWETPGMKKTRYNLELLQTAGEG
jgi:hypothetical protein